MAIFYNDYAPANNGIDAAPIQEVNFAANTGSNYQTISDLETVNLKKPVDNYAPLVPAAISDYPTADNDRNAALPRHLKVVFIRSNRQIKPVQRLCKRLFDIVFAITVMILGLPVFAIFYLITKFSSPGPAFYKQERIGRDRRSFYIYKFRSMYVDAEKAGPQLSRSGDPRITKWGRLIRRTRIDELPQFWNVLKGDMSIVGPRPERQHYINKIMEHRPDYANLQALRPGITSSGQVYYGYAENVDQMCERMVHDLHYLNNMSLQNDLRVIAETVKVVFQAKGK